MKRSRVITAIAMLAADVTICAAVLALDPPMWAAVVVGAAMVAIAFSWLALDTFCYLERKRLIKLTAKTLMYQEPDYVKGIVPAEVVAVARKLANGESA